MTLDVAMIALAIAVEVVLVVAISRWIWRDRPSKPLTGSFDDVRRRAENGPIDLDDLTKSFRQIELDIRRWGASHDQPDHR